MGSPLRRRARKHAAAGEQGARARPETLNRLHEVVEGEARRIAHALHDEAGQLLASVHLALETLARDLPPDVRPRLEPIRGLLGQVEAQLRQVAHELRPRLLDDLGLEQAVEVLAQGISGRTGLHVRVDGSTQGRLPLMLETALYRIVQEALTNAARHARATRVRVWLRRGREVIRCAVRDDGVGFDVRAVERSPGSRGLGLVGIRERVAALGGTLCILSGPGKGTTLSVELPLAER